MLISIRPTVNKFYKRPQIALKLEEQKIKTGWQDIMQSINPKGINKTEALYINENKELVVRVSNHLWLQEMVFYKKDFDKKLAGYININSVRFVL